MITALPFGATSITQLAIAIFSGGTFAAVLSFFIKWRGLTHSAERILRDHYANELARLTKRIEEKDEHILRIEEHLRGIIKTADERYEECQREREDDREQIKRLQEEVGGLRRQVPIQSANRLLIMEKREIAERAPEALKAAKRVKNGNQS